MHGCSNLGSQLLCSCVHMQTFCMACAAAAGGLPRPCVVVRVAAPAPASTPATAAADDEGSRYLQRIPGLPELELLRGPAEAPIETSTSGRTGGQLLGPAEQRAVLARRNLAVNGHYMLQVRILGNIFSRARNSSTQSGTPSSPPTGQAKLAAGSSAAKKHVGAAAKPKTAVKRPSRAQDTRPARARLQPGRQQEAGKAGRRSFVQACEDAAASGVANTPRVASAFSSVPALQKRVAEGMPIVEDILNAMAGISSTPLSTLLPGVSGGFLVTLCSCMHTVLGAVHKSGRLHASTTMRLAPLTMAFPFTR